MAISDYESTATWKVDVSQFNAAIEEAKKYLTEANNEFKVTASSMEKWSDNATGLEAKLHQLNHQWQAATRYLELYRSALDEAITNNDEKNIERYNKLIVKQQINANKATVAFNKWSKELDTFKGETTETLTPFQKLSQEIEHQQQVVDTLKDAYKDSIVANNPEEMQKLSTELVQASTKLAEMKQRMNDAKSAADVLDRSIAKTASDENVAVSAYDNLTQEIKDQQDKVDALKNEYASAVIQFGKTSTKAEELGKEVKEASGELKNMKEKLASADKEAENLDQSIDKAGESAKTAANGGFTVLKSALANLISQGISKVISGMKSLASDALAYQNELEGYKISFEVMTGSAEKAAEMIDKLGTIVKKTPFDMPTLADTTQLLMNYGFTAEEAIDKMTMLGDISQGNSEKLGRIALAYGQMNSAGKVLLQDLKQMIEAGFNPLQEISDRTGESMASLYKRISKGTLKVSEIEKAFVNATSAGGKYYKSMDKQSQSFSGRLEALKEQANATFGSVMSPLLQKISDRLLPRLTEMIEKVDTTKLARGFSDFGEKVIQAFDWIVENGSEVLDVLQQIAVAFVTYKAVSIIGSVVSAFSSLVTMIRTGTTVMTALNTVFGLSPVALVAAGFGLLAAAVYTTAKRSREAMEAQYGLNEEQKKTIDDVAELTAQYNDLNTARKESLTSINSEYGYLYELKDEYNSLIGANGKVKEGYEDRAQFIITTLAEALGVEESKIKKLIQKNGELGESIDKLIEKKKAEAVLSANEQLYNQAIQERATAFEKLSAAQKTVEEAERTYIKAQEDSSKVWDKYNKLIGQGRLSEAKSYLEANNTIIQGEAEAKAAWESASKTVEEAEQTWINYNSTIKNYEGLSEAIISGDAKKINEAMANMTYNFITAENGNRESLERQVENYKTNLDALEKAIQNGTPYVTQDMVDQAKSMVDAANAELDKLPPEASETGTKAGTDFAKGVGSKKELVTTKSKLLADAADIGVTPSIDKLSKAGESAGKEFGDAVGSTENTKGAKGAAEDLADEAEKGAKSKNGKGGGAEQAGKGFTQGFSGGISAWDVVQGVISAASALAGTALSALRNALGERSPSKMTRQSGVYYGEGFRLGIEDMFSSVKSTAGELGVKAVESLRDSLSDEMYALGADSGNSLIEGMNSIVPNMADSIDNLKASVASSNASMNDANVAGVGSFGVSGGNVQNVTFNQTINSPKATDRLTIYRETNSLLFSAKVRMQNV